MNAPITEADLHAYADHRLSPERAAQVAEWLARHPDAAQEVDAWRALNDRLHGAYDATLEKPVPQHLLPAEETLRRAGWPGWSDARVWRQAAAVAWLALGTLIGYQWHARSGQASGDMPVAQALPRLAAVAHAVYAPEVRHPVEVAADQEAHLTAWLSKRLGAQLKVPRLEPAGFQLVGGRLLPGAQREVAQFMYEDASQRRLTLYVQPQAVQPEQAGFRQAREGAIEVFYWVDGSFGYALSGQIGRDEMGQLATMVYQQLQP